MVLNLIILKFEDILFDSADQQKLSQICQFYYKELNKWGKNEREGGYQKRVVHDRILELDDITNRYRKLKEKYGYWVDQWEESTDPHKFIFEDIGIASFLIGVWEEEEKKFGLKKKQSFVDLGCGNGFLVYLLSMEGYQGRGIDLKKRKVWDKYPPSITLMESAIQPSTEVYSEDWLIANHADELTPWIPLLASRHTSKKQEDEPQLGQRYFVLPCCEWDFDKKFSKKLEGVSRFMSYVKYIESIGTKSGFLVETEHLRIPSTRNIAQIGRYRDFDINDENAFQKIQKEQEKLLKDAKFLQFVPKFRKDHKIK